jgi:MamI restriction endonuclease
MSGAQPPSVRKEVLELLELHYASFHAVVKIATETEHPVPVDTRGWSQILVSVLTGLKGMARQKGADLVDGSDVKGANTWEAIDTPRFNGVIKAGTKAKYAGKLASLDDMPFLFFVMWDHRKPAEIPRCRIWCVRTQQDREFRAMCERWYNACLTGEIKSTNFQLHPPRGKDTDVFTNTYGNLKYPLFFSAERGTAGYTVTTYDPAILKSGNCTKA